MMNQMMMKFLFYIIKLQFAFRDIVYLLIYKLSHHIYIYIKINLSCT